MGTIYQRGDSQFLWVAYFDATGKRRHLSAKSTDHAFAEKLLARLEAEVASQKASGVKKEGPLTVERYAKMWIDRRHKRGIASANSDANRLEHALPVIGSMPLAEVKRGHILRLVEYLKTEARTRSPKMAPAPLSPRLVRHVYAALRQMFDEAVAEEIIQGNPCNLKASRGELPKKRDKNPAWRSTAVLSRAEVELLLSDERIPSYRRVLYGLVFLGGLRINEATIRRWEQYEPDEKPLGKLRVISSYDVKRRTEKPGTKTGNAREVPVHPLLAKMLAQWRLSGWEAFQARRPEASDLIVPAPTGKVLNSNSTLLRFHEDLALLGFRPRRQHDLRRTFISLALADGASKDTLRWITHGPEGDIVDLYNTPPWHSLCEQVARLRIQLREGAVLSIKSTGGRYAPVTANGGQRND